MRHLKHSKPHALLLLHLKAMRVREPVSEHRFHPTRKWRFDLCWPDLMLACEVHGGTWTGGRHVRGKGFEEDCEKLAEAAILGWRVIPVTSAMVEDGRAVRLLKRAASGASSSACPSAAGAS